MISIQGPPRNNLGSISSKFDAIYEPNTRGNLISAIVNQLITTVSVRRYSSLPPALESRGERGSDEIDFYVTHQ